MAEIPMKFKLTHSLALIAILTFVFQSAALAGKIYKWVDENGNVQYGAEKPNSGAQEIKVKTKTASETTADESEAKSDENDNPDNKEPEQSAEKGGSNNDAEALRQKNAEIDKKNAEIRQHNCANAKKRAATIGQGGRLYEVDEKGERQYWDDNTRKGKLEEAQAQIDEWCK
jgi:hypothetical protein